jgi:hypothetical protein
MKLKDMFDGKLDKRVSHLESELKKSWERVVKLEQEIKERPSDIEREAKNASKKAAEFRNKTETRLNKATSLVAQIEEKAKNYATITTEIDSLKSQLNAAISGAKLMSDQVVARSNELVADINRIDEIFTLHPDLKSKVADLEVLIDSLEENNSKANSTYKGILTRKSDIDKLHREIIGYEDEDEEGNEVHVDGKKDELEKAYDKISSDIENSDDRISKVESNGIEKIDKLIEANQAKLSATIDKTKKEYDNTIEKITSLLPNAMTAGLSSAFIAKKAEEVIIYEEYKKKFNKGIWLLVLVSLMPIAVSIAFLSTGSSLIEIVERVPKLVLAFLPIYAPLIWSAISANKKVNLSKRLIEEYSHKQVLSMTIEGLSKQIESVEDFDVMEELRIKLLSNFLNVSSDNPGKLISNYDRSDNPLVEYFQTKKTTKKNSDNGEESIVTTIEKQAKVIVDDTADKIGEGVTSAIKGVLPNQ